MKNKIKFFSLCLLSLCIDTYAQVPGTPYILPSLSKIPGNTYCDGKTISVTSCSSISGASINDDATTTLGTEYDWTGATGYIANNTTTRALVEIGGQCWYRINADRVPSNYSTSPTWSSTDNGAHGYPPGGPYGTMGRAYQFLAAMDGSTTERAQGVCANGFHVPSDCEWMYLENTLGMPVSSQIATGSRSGSSVSERLRSYGISANNASGFSGSIDIIEYISGGGWGVFDAANSYPSYGEYTAFRTSTSQFNSRIMGNYYTGFCTTCFHRQDQNVTPRRADGYALRCIAD